MNAPAPPPGVATPTALDAGFAPFTWLDEHMGDIGMALGIASLVAIVPVAPRASATAARAATTEVATASVATTAAVAATHGATGLGVLARVGGSIEHVAPGAARSARSGWAALRSARLALGRTDAGRLLVAAQGPVAVGGSIVGGVNLARDINDFREGHGSWTRLALDSLAVAPAVSAGVKRIANARAAGTEATAAVQVASKLTQAESKATAALTTSTSKLGVGNELVDEIATATTTTRTVQATVRDRASHVATQATFAPRATGIVPTTPTFVVADLKGAVAQVESTTSRALEMARAKPPIAGLEAPLDEALTLAQGAQRQLRQAEMVSARLTATARGAQTMQGAAARTSWGAGLLNNSVQLTSAQRSGNGDKSFTSATGIGRSLLGWLLGKNAATAAVAATPA